MARRPTVAPMGKAQEHLPSHGDLRAALIAAARHVLETARPEEITLEVPGPQTGRLTTRALSAFCANRDALLAASPPTDSSASATAWSPHGTRCAENEAFLQSCLAYLEFARANRGVYRLMFASQLLREADDEALDRASAAAFDFLLEGVAPDRSARAGAGHRRGSGRRCMAWPCWR